MPLFEFTCRDCGHRFEALVTPSRTAACPSCSSTHLEKMHSTFATQSSTRTSDSSAPASRFT